MKTTPEEHLTRHLLEQVKDYAIFMINDRGVIASWNEGVKNLLGYDEAEFIGQPFSIIFTPEDRSLLLHEAELKRAQTEGRAEDFHWHMRKDGSLLWANGIVTPVMDDQEQLIGFAKIMQDQTEKKKIEEDLVSQSNALIEANKELARFAGIVSHDLNAPLQTVYGFANHLSSQTVLSGESKESLEHIISGTEKMMHLVHELLNDAKGQEETNLELVESETVLKDTLVGLRAAIAGTRAKVTYADLPPVWAHALGLKRIFQNLIQNSIKYRSEGISPQIHVDAKRHEGGEIRFCVADNGIGIQGDEGKSAAFDRYTRLHSSGEGSGIGLASCKHIVEGWKGKIWIEDNDPTGCKVFFTIPEVEVKTTDQISSKEERVLAVQPVSP